MKRLFYLLPLLLILTVSGCVKSRVYLMEKERVDQDIPGVPAPAVPKTRQVFVLEIVEKDKGQTVSTVTSATQDPVAHESLSTLPKKADVPVVPAAESGEVAAVSVPLEYKVEKDDTLQKISKKVYGSFGQWTRIYDENKKIIKDPNILKPGTILSIPARKETVGSDPE